MLPQRRNTTKGPRGPLVSLALGALLLVAIPSHAQTPVAYRDAMETAMRCVHAAMTDALLPIGVMPEQIANAALARCFDEIESAAGAAIGSSGAAKVDSVRTVLRKELYEYALQLSGVSHRHASYAGETGVDAYAAAGSWLPDEANEPQPTIGTPPIF